MNPQHCPGWYRRSSAVVLGLPAPMGTVLQSSLKMEYAVEPWMLVATLVKYERARCAGEPQPRVVPSWVMLARIEVRRF